MNEEIINTDELHPATKEILRFFEFEHLPPHLQAISKEFYRLAYVVVQRHNLKGAEVTVCLRKLLEAKDCAVRAAL